ncbi:MAG: BamA/TamA family outer membrane protein [Pseudomonadota bacterium]
MPLRAQEPASEDAGEQASQDQQETKRKAAGIAYTVDITGEQSKALRGALRGALPVFTDRKSPPSSRAALRERLAKSLTIGRDVLKSEGYYAGRVYGRVLPPQELGGKARVMLEVNAGKQYVFGPLVLDLQGTSEASLQDTLRDTANELYRQGEPARALTGLRIAPALALRLKELGYPFAKVADQRFVVDHATQLVRPKISLQTGRKARISGLALTGLQTVKPDYVEQLADISAQPVYDQRDVETFRGRLIATGLFSGISIQPMRAAQQSPAAAGEPDLEEVALKVDLTEGPMRQVSAQAGFSTDQGFSVEGAWSHRNFFGSGQIFTVRGRLAQLEQLVETELAFPNFQRNDQTFRVTLGIGRESTDAFDALRVQTTAILERQLSQRWGVSGGGRLEAQRIEDDLGRRTFYLGAIPLLARYDGTEDIFDPQDGLRLNLQVTPETGFGAATLFFVTNDVLVRAYRSFDWANGTVLAARVRVGSIVGEDTATLPANRRFFAGGGGSIRGYGFQQVGPLDGAGDPFGGRSLLEMAIEARVKVTETIGVVPFIDAGNVYSTVLPKFSGLQYGAGIGVRYHTDFAPIRLDIGTPLNPRDGDDRIQVYISVGQSF